jgi:two-component system chemotaxis sensor kinase CheA
MKLTGPDFDGFEAEIELLWQTFRIESGEHLARIEDALLELENDPDDGGALNSAFRAAHTLKGNARSLDAEQVAELADRLEDVLALLRDSSIGLTRALTSQLLAAVDILRDLVSKAGREESASTPEQTSLLDQLAAIVRGEQTAATGSTLASDALAGLEPQRNEGSWSRSHHTLRVGIDKLDAMLDLTGEIAIARGRLTQALEERAAGTGSLLLELHQQADQLCMSLQEQVMKARMVPVGPTFQRYTRVVRDLGETLGKPAQLLIEGGDVEVDTAIIEQLKDPLTHMIRNALDHGIEELDARLACGKPPFGQIVLRAFHEAGSIVVQVEDDGAGIDRERILERLREIGRAPEGDQLDDQDLVRLVLEPGFSTVAEPTELSGRGVGLDVVSQQIENLRGSIAINSRAGRGTCITLRLPLTLAIIEGLQVRIGEETYVIPHESVLECADLASERSEQGNGHGITRLRDEALPFLRLRNLFDIAGRAPQRESLVVVQNGDGLAGIAVDSIHGASQTVIKPLGKIFGQVPFVTGSAILGNGRVALILDVPAVFSHALNHDSTAPQGEPR